MSWLALMAVVAAGMCTGCSGNPDKKADESSASDDETVSSSAIPVDSHTFSGKGTRMKHFHEDNDLVTLSGEYDVNWKVVGNRPSSSGAKEGPFELSLFCEVDREVNDLERIKIANETLFEGSGDKKISVPKPEECQVNVVASDPGKWKVTIKRR